MAYSKLLEEAQTQNFVLDFGNEDAWCAVNLEREDVASLLRYPVSILIHWLFGYYGDCG